MKTKEIKTAKYLGYSYNCLTKNRVYKVLNETIDGKYVIFNDANHIVLSDIANFITQIEKVPILEVELKTGNMGFRFGIAYNVIYEEDKFYAVSDDYGCYRRVSKDYFVKKKTYSAQISIFDSKRPGSFCLENLSKSDLIEAATEYLNSELED